MRTATVVAGRREPTWVMVHSPLIGPTSWSPAADELRRRGPAVVVPSLVGVADAPAPQWRHVPQTVRSATNHLRGSIVLVGHSGAGLQRFEAARGVATPDGSDVPYQRIAELTFDDIDALQAGLGSEQGQAAVKRHPQLRNRRGHDLHRRSRLTGSPHERHCGRLALFALSETAQAMYGASLGRRWEQRP